MTEQELIEIAKQKGLTDEQIAGAFAKRQANSLQAPTQPTTFKDKLGTGVGNALSTMQQVYGGVKPKDTDLQGDILKTILGEKAKALYRDPIQQEKDRSIIDSNNARTEALKSMASADIPEGFVRVGGKIVRDPAYKRQPTPEEIGKKIQYDIDLAELKDQSKALPKLAQAEQAAKQLKELYYRGFKPKSVKDGDVIGGILTKTSGIGSSISALSGANPELGQYGKNREAFSGLISKGGFGEAGMLTQQDINRIKAILPSEYSTKEEAEIAWSEIETILSIARMRFERRKRGIISNYQEPGQFESSDEPQIDDLEQINSEIEAINRELGES